VIKVDEHFQQIFDISFLKIGTIANAGVLQIGCGAGKAQRAPSVGYTTIGTSLVHLTAPQPFAIPLQSSVPRKNRV